jgi:serine protease AprX
MISKKLKSAMWGRSILVACVLLVSASLACAGPHKMSKDLEGKKGSDQVDVIVQFSHMPTAANHRKVLKRGGKLKKELRLFKSGAYRVPASELADLVADPEVVHISPDRPIRSTSTGTPVIDFHTDTVNAPVAWAQGLDGTGIGVAIIDSGIAPVSDLNSQNLVYSQDFVGDNGGSPSDLYGHGTHVAGIIAGTGKNSRGNSVKYTFQGIAKNASLINLRVLGQDGSGTDSDVIEAIQTAIQLKDTYNIRVINLSVGRGVYESYTVDPLCQAVEQAWAAGIVVVVSAGNDGRDNSAGTNGYGTITAPGNDPYVITVGAMNTLGTADRTDDVPASYSSKGPTLWDQVVKPDLVAPGNLIVSLYNPGDTLNQEFPANAIPYSLYVANGTSTHSKDYFVLSGTSMAAPMVSGAAALLLQQNPALTPDQLKVRLMKTAFKNLVPNATATDSVTGQTFSLQADIFTVGAGYLDIQAALADTYLAPATPGAAMSPAAALDSDGNVVMVNSNSVLSGQNAFGLDSDGLSVMWGTSAMGTDSSGLSVMWGTAFSGTDSSGFSVMWGTAAMAGTDSSGFSVMWGTSSASAESVMWGCSVMWGSSTSGAEVSAHGDSWKK